MTPKRTHALAVSAGLSVLFLIVYGGCNWITAHRGDVGVFYFEWERAIPFVPFLILPYMSIDLFYIAAPFLCRSERELSIFAKRVVAAILFAGTCFLLFPLRFAFPRPHANGWIGAIFDWFREMDAPYNLFPSLHAALWLFLVNIYARHLRGVFLIGAMVWFALIALSPVLTYQHHIIDIGAGFVLAGYCFYFFRESPAKLPVIKNQRVGFYYSAAAIFLFAFALLAVKRLGFLAKSFSRHCCRCLLWSWARNFSQDKWRFALERTARLRSLFAGSVFIFAPLPSSMSALG